MNALIKKYITSFTGIRNILALLFISISVGIIGFMLIEHLSFLDALYLTIITVSTIGFETVVPLSNTGKIFIIFYIVFNLVALTPPSGN